MLPEEMQRVSGFLAWKIWNSGRNSGLDKYNKQTKEWEFKLNREQQVILTLLREIDEICGQNGIECYLTPRLALHAVRGGHMPDNHLPVVY